MVGALLAHLRVGDAFTNMVPAAVYLVLALAMVALRRDAYRSREHAGAEPG
ncbi:MAG: hypothetical protein M3157_08125 [Actinomycetota bacterium]|nr:hypothetical protein [Actinomycetota bacterium]